MPIASIIGIITLLLVTVVYSALFISKKPDREYKKLKKEILEEMKNSNEVKK